MVAFMRLPAHFSRNIQSHAINHLLHTVSFSCFSEQLLSTDFRSLVVTDHAGSSFHSQHHHGELNDGKIQGGRDPWRSPANPSAQR